MRLPRRTLIIPLALVLAVVAGWLILPTVKAALAPASPLQLRISMTPDEVRVVLGEPSVRMAGLWRYLKPGGDAVDVMWRRTPAPEPTLTGWVNTEAGVVVGVEGMPGGPPAGRGPWP